MNKAIETSTLSYGAFPTTLSCSFRVFCPASPKVILELFDHFEDRSGRRFTMQKNDDGVWELDIPENLIDKYYGYRITPPQNYPGFLATNELVADPWSKHVTTVNHYRQYAKTKIIGDDHFDWEDDKFVAPQDSRDLVIYETHLKDMTAHPSAGSSRPGTYQGFIEDDIIGGINHLKRLGVNAVEFLPLQKFSGFEPPFKQKTPEGFYNTWNPYSRNHWGYMTSFFFAPETMFANDGSDQPGAMTGKSTHAITDLKKVVKALHEAGITVIMDVVYNHVSHYDINPFMYLDKPYFFRHDDHHNMLSESGTGNDFKTEAPIARQAIVESICYWMDEFHIDGFRFDLANLIDRDTIQSIRNEASKINPDVLLIAEPWGGGYDPTGFSALGWSSWNDQIRNGVKGSGPVDNKGFIFGTWQHETSREALENIIRGTLVNSPNGRFHTSSHSVNYLEAHDGYTLGDFIRIGLDASLKSKRIPNKAKLTRLNDHQTRIAKLGALFLFVSQGVTMVHAGQEWARSKAIAECNVHDKLIGHLDHNSYEKDNDTNYLNFEEIEINHRLFEYYRGLIALRRNSPALRKASQEDIIFTPYEDPLHLTFSINGESSGDPYDYLVSVNGNLHGEQTLDLQSNYWEMVVSPRVASHKKLVEITGTVKIPPSSGVVFRRRVRDV
ncbi:MAG: alpha-amylase family glycosyl hydrolase [Balneolales bacterium]